MELLLYLYLHTQVEWVCAGSSYELLDPAFKPSQRCDPMLVYEDGDVLEVVNPMELLGAGLSEPAGNQP